ncbi:MAG: hypothetical protein PHV34_13150 [Verrucomicrobiae bacterium]|nr:hypothetical protein [Verrucomicrobiae bacterium]
MNISCLNFIFLICTSFIFGIIKGDKIIPKRVDSDSAAAKQSQLDIANPSKESLRIEKACIGEWEGIEFLSCHSAPFKWLSIAFKNDGSIKYKIQKKGQSEIIEAEEKFRVIHKGSNDNTPGKKPIVLILDHMDKKRGMIILKEVGIDLDNRIPLIFGEVLKFQDLDGNTYCFKRPDNTLGLSPLRNLRAEPSTL